VDQTFPYSSVQLILKKPDKGAELAYPFLGATTDTFALVYTVDTLTALAEKPSI
jgi:hypothetical protein